MAAYVTQGGGMSLYPAQNDTIAFPDDCDATFPLNLDFVLPSNFQNMLSARLSFKLRPYRTFNTFSVTNTGAGTAHSHSHTHSISVSGNVANPAGVSLSLDAGNAYTAANDANTVIAVAGTWGPGTGSNATTEATHTHPINTSSFLGITEDTPPVNPAITITVDGANVTAALGGPFQTDQLELDIRPYVGKGAGAFHLVSLQPNQRCRVHGILKLSYTVSPSLH